MSDTIISDHVRWFIYRVLHNSWNHSFFQWISTTHLSELCWILRGGTADLGSSRSVQLTSVWLSVLRVRPALVSLFSQLNLFNTRYLQVVPEVLLPMPQPGVSLTPQIGPILSLSYMFPLFQELLSWLACCPVSWKMALSCICLVLLFLAAGKPGPFTPSLWKVENTF